MEKFISAIVMSEISLVTIEHNVGLICSLFDHREATPAILACVATIQAIPQSTKEHNSSVRLLYTTLEQSGFWHPDRSNLALATKNMPEALTVDVEDDIRTRLLASIWTMKWATTTERFDRVLKHLTQDEHVYLGIVVGPTDELYAAVDEEPDALIDKICKRVVNFTLGWTTPSWVFVLSPFEPQHCHNFDAVDSRSFIRLD